MKFRKCYVLREIEIPMGDLKKGDIFRLEKASETDCVNTKEWSIAEQGANPCEPDGNVGIEASPISFIKQISSDGTNF